MPVWKLIAAAVLVGLVLGLVGGITVQQWHYGSVLADAKLQAEQERRESVQRALDQAQEIARQDNEILAAGEKRRQAANKRYQTLTREVQDHVSQNPKWRDPECSVGSDGLRRIIAAARGGYPAAGASGQPDGAMPGLASTGLWPFGRAVSDPDLVGRGVLRLPTAATGSGGFGAGADGR